MCYFFLTNIFEKSLSVVDAYQTQAFQNDLSQEISHQMFLQSLEKNDIWQLNHQKQFRNI